MRKPSLYVCGARRPAVLGSPRFICTVRGPHTAHEAETQPGHVVATWRDCPRCGRPVEKVCPDCEVVSHG